MSYPHLAGYLALRDPNGSCVEVFNGCRTLENAQNGQAHSMWRTVYGDVWGGCCCWAWHDGPYLNENAEDVNPDPWYDPLVPASSEVAGALIDPPDGSGNGFYIEPSSSPRFFDGSTATPLEMYATFSVVAKTDRGERYFIRWLNGLLSNCCVACDGWEAVVFETCPCEDEFDGVECDENNLLVFELPESQRPEKPERVCDEAGLLEAWDGDVPAPPDTGFRQILKVEYKGLEVLSDEFWGCGGGRYKILFDVISREWFADDRLQCSLGGLGAWDECHCFVSCLDECVDIPCPVDNCGPDPALESSGFDEPVFDSSVLATQDNFGGQACVEGRYTTPFETRLNTCLTLPQPDSVTNRVKVEVTNGTGIVRNARVVIWPAYIGVADPSTIEGWDYYQQIAPVYEKHIIRMRPGEVLTIDYDGETTVACPGGGSTDGYGTVELGADQPPDLVCDRRYWIGLEMSCEPESYGGNDLSADVYFAQVNEP